MRRSVVPSSGAKSPPHVVVIGNQKGGTGKSTFAMHIIVALLKAGKRVASFDLDLNQLTLTRYLGNRHEWDRKHEQKLELPDHYPVSEEVPGAPLRQFISRLKKIGRAHKDDFIAGSALSHSADLRQFISQLRKIGRARKHDFIVIDTPGGVQHLSLIVHGMADTLITPINDSLVDLDVLVAMDQSELEPQPSIYAKMVWRALEARRKVSGRVTDWIVVRNRLETGESSNQRQITEVLDVIRRTLGFRIARGLLERPVYREFFAAGLTVFDQIEGVKSATESDRPELLARLEVQNLIREIGLINEAGLKDEAFHEIEPGMPGANAEAKDVAGVDYGTNILAYSALSENGRAVRSREMQKLLLGYRDNMRVEVETGIAVTAKTVADLRALTAWPDGLALNIHVDLDPRFSVVRVERAARVVHASGS
jgi:chromosome partitioning protein